MTRLRALTAAHRLGALVTGLVAVLLIGVAAYAVWPTSSPTALKVRTRSSPMASPAASTTPSAPASDSAAATPPASPPTALSHASYTLDDASNGTTITVNLGDEITVTLASTYWTIASPSNQTVLVPQGAQQTSPGASCPRIPGTGCGTATRSFLAQAAGTSLLSAHRTACGEALACTGAQGSWQATVVVRAS